MPSVTAKTRSAAAAHGAARAIHAATAAVSKDRIMLGEFLARKTQGRGRHRALRMRADNRTTTRLSVRLRVTRSISHRRGALERGLALIASSAQRVALSTNLGLHPPAAAAHKRRF